MLNHRVFIILWSLLLTLGLASQIQARTAMAASENEQPSKHWRQQIQHSLQQRMGQQLQQLAHDMGQPTAKLHIQIETMDSRLNFSPCASPLQVDEQNGIKLGRNHIKVSCLHPKPWALNVPVFLDIWAPVVVLNQPIPRGMEFKAKHLTLINKSLASLRNGFFLDKNLLIGKQSKRALSGQTVLNRHLILPALLVRKGDRVMIVANRGAMSVKMPGEALNDGREGRQIRVKNSRSGRIIRGKVLANGEVAVNF